MSLQGKENCVRWLEALLKLRFHPAIKLRERQSGQLQLALNGHPTPIKLPALKNAFFHANKDLPCARWDGKAEDWLTVSDTPLPAPGVSELPQPLITKVDSTYTIGYDILGLTYWMLSRQEEAGRTDLDEHGRFPATASHAYKHGYLERPIVDEWLQVLKQIIQRTWPQLKLKQHDFNIKVSHDVDTPSYYAFRPWSDIPRICAGHVLKRLNPKQAIQAPIIKLNSKKRLHVTDPANTFDWIMDTSEQYGLTSAFYFICGRTDASKDADYDIAHPAILHLMRRIHERGHEIGLHPSYNTYQNPHIIVNEAKRLKQACAQEGIQQAQWGGRMHYLRWEQPTTLQGWEQAGMSYDSSLGYADHAGFRCGTCFEYPAFDPQTQQMLNLNIRPLIAMECSIMDAAYMNLGHGEAALDKLTELRNKCKAVNGSFTLLWHNNRLINKEERKLYQTVVSASC